MGQQPPNRQQPLEQPQRTQTGWLPMSNSLLSKRQFQWSPHQPRQFQQQFHALDQAQQFQWTPRQPGQFQQFPFPPNNSPQSHQQDEITDYATLHEGKEPRVEDSVKVGKKRGPLLILLLVCTILLLDPFWPGNDTAGYVPLRLESLSTPATIMTQAVTHAPTAKASQQIVDVPKLGRAGYVVKYGTGPSSHLFDDVKGTWDVPYPDCELTNPSVGVIYLKGTFVAGIGLGGAQVGGSSGNSGAFLWTESSCDGTATGNITNIIALLSGGGRTVIVRETSDASVTGEIRYLGNSRYQFTVRSEHMAPVTVTLSGGNQPDTAEWSMGENAAGDVLDNMTGWAQQPRFTNCFADGKSLNSYSFIYRGYAVHNEDTGQTGPKPPLVPNDIGPDGSSFTVSREFIN